MLYRKIERVISNYFQTHTDKVLVVTGARQIGKSYIIRYCASKHFKYVVEVNLSADALGIRLFDNVRTIEDFYIALSAYTSDTLGDTSDTLIFLDEIQEYPHLLTLLKFLREDNKYRYVVSGSLLGVTLRKTTSVPVGSIDIVRMYPLDFEEFMLAAGIGNELIAYMQDRYKHKLSLPIALHNRVMDVFKRYLLVGGLPEAVNIYLDSHDLNKVRFVQRSIIDLYKIDATKYDKIHALKINRIYDLIPSNMENKKKRLIYKDIEGKEGRRSKDYEEEIEYLVSSGTTLEVKAISNPKFPLLESEQKNLIKLYYNDPGLLTAVLYSNNPTPILTTECSVNLGSVYECAVACQLAANDNKLFYYDNRSRGEVDFLYDDYVHLSVVPIEVKSGKDYKRHIAISRLISTNDYGIEQGYVLSNSADVEVIDNIIHAPIYYSIFFTNDLHSVSPITI